MPWAPRCSGWSSRRMCRDLRCAETGNTPRRMRNVRQAEIITRLERAGDSHGWHWDDYAFALVWVVECPPPADGGSVQGVPRTRWNKREPGGPDLASHPIHSWYLQPGDAYLMRTDTTLHCTGSSPSNVAAGRSSTWPSPAATTSPKLCRTRQWTRCGRMLRIPGEPRHHLVARTGTFGWNGMAWLSRAAGSIRA